MQILYPVNSLFITPNKISITLLKMLAHKLQQISYLPLEPKISFDCVCILFILLFRCLLVYALHVGAIRKATTNKQQQLNCSY